MVASDWAIWGGISRAVNRRGMMTALRESLETQHVENAPAMQPLPRMLGANMSNQRLDLRQNVRHDRVDAGGVGVQTVALQQVQVAGNAVEKERIERGAIFGGKLGIDALEGLTVVGAEIGRGAHAAQQDNNMTRGETA